MERAATRQAVGVELNSDLKVISQTAWLSHPDKLETIASKEFGRTIEASIRSLKAAGRPLALKLRNKFAAVVIGNDEYAELLSLKAKYADLVVRVKNSDIASAANEFDELFARISAPQTAKAFKSLRHASTEDLASTFKPGGTETN